MMILIIWLINQTLPYFFSMQFMVVTWYQTQTRNLIVKMAILFEIFIFQASNNNILRVINTTSFQIMTCWFLHFKSSKASSTRSMQIVPPCFSSKVWFECWREWSLQHITVVSIATNQSVFRQPLQCRHTASTTKALPCSLMQEQVLNCSSTQGKENLLQ